MIWTEGCNTGFMNLYCEEIKHSVTNPDDICLHGCFKCELEEINEYVVITPGGDLISFLVLLINRYCFDGEHCNIWNINIDLDLN